MDGCFVEKEVLDGPRLILIQKDELLSSQVGEKTTLGVQDTDGNLDVVGPDFE